MAIRTHFAWLLNVKAKFLNGMAGLILEREEYYRLASSPPIDNKLAKR
ncbi:hypothetical protein GMES_3808 [Paraglaciecola mesophila KMM 241]|uniref:Uncharacterized protein n=1 Tax=Paraglaciecola mesophila KMM 241 TaxID=1128912 RepID=K6ZAS6_9ALTE|nr:hypothetical protein GMES_3808 [Paraglaciecola mesophila KMM 241]